MHYLGFEAPLEEMEAKLEEFKNADKIAEAESLQQKIDKWLDKTYGNLAPIQTLEVARHPLRPSFADYIQRAFSNYQPLAGDRMLADNIAIAGGLARFRGRAVCVIGNDKGSSNPSRRAAHKFGMAMPEGYRKAIRLMKLAEKFSLPLITLVDTPGAFPGVQAEQRGQSAAISACITTAMGLKSPSVAVITGEGGSGGAVALATANRVLMLEHAVYSVISPEGCASILWRDGKKMAAAAKSLKITAAELARLKVIDEVIKEPPGGAHRDLAVASSAVANGIEKALTLLETERNYADSRRRKFLSFGDTTPAESLNSAS